MNRVQLWTLESTMTLTRFQTSKRTWLTVSLVLFLASWFLRVGKADGDLIWSLWGELFDHPSFELFLALSVFTLAFGVPAIIFGWVIQCFIVMAFSFSKRRRNHLV